MKVVESMANTIMLLHLESFHRAGKQPYLSHKYTCTQNKIKMINNKSLHLPESVSS